MYDTLIRGALVYDGTGGAPLRTDVALEDGRIAALGELGGQAAAREIEARGLALAPGFIDVHTHDDTNVIRQPQMLPKLSQGVTTVVVGNCGISASPVSLKGEPPDPMNLLGAADDFRYPSFAAYTAAVDAARPAVNVAALVGHTALRNNHMDRLDRSASATEIEGMRAQLREALAHGAIGLSTGWPMPRPSRPAPMKSRRWPRSSMSTARSTPPICARSSRKSWRPCRRPSTSPCTPGSPVVVSHLKCAGAGNWGRSGEVLSLLDTAGRMQPVGCDCYPYSASSSTLDLKQVTADFDIDITWSTPCPEKAGRKLADIAADWGISLLEAARRLQPAGAVYHGMHEDDVRRVLSHRLTMIGSDGLPNDPLPHPRLWGAFPRVLGHYSRDLKLFPLQEAVHKMTGLSARRFGLAGRGEIRVGHHADLVLFNPATVADRGTFIEPVQPAAGIEGVWVNGVLSYCQGRATGERAGRWLPRAGDLRRGFAP